MSIASTSASGINEATPTPGACVCDSEEMCEEMEGVKMVKKKRGDNMKGEA